MVQQPAVFPIVAAEAVFHFKLLPRVEAGDVDFQAAGEVLRVDAFRPAVPIFLRQRSPGEVEPDFVEKITEFVHAREPDERGGGIGHRGKAGFTFLRRQFRLLANGDVLSHAARAYDPARGVKDRFDADMDVPEFAIARQDGVLEIEAHRSAREQLRHALGNEGLFLQWQEFAGVNLRSHLVAAFVRGGRAVKRVKPVIESEGLGGDVHFPMGELRLIHRFRQPGLKRPQGLLRLLARGNVLVESLDEGLALMRNQGDRDFEREDVAILVEMFHLEAQNFPGLQPAHPLRQVLHGFGGIQILQPQGQHFRHRVAVHPGQRFVDLQHFPGERPN